MLSVTDLHAMARARVDDAKALLAAGRYDGAVYIVGYAIEFRLKARIAAYHLSKKGWPETAEEFSVRSKLQTHDLEQLLKYSGRQPKVDNVYKPPWSLVLQKWGPNSRYKRVGNCSEKEAREMIESVRVLLKVL